MRSVWLVRAAVLLLCAGTAKTLAQEASPMTPVMIGLFNPAQVPADHYDVAGFRLNLIYGKCHDLTGLDLGLVNAASGNETGLELGLVNTVGGAFNGLQVGLVNVADRTSALQLGLYNGADDASGLQIGLINHARMMRGLQLGLINIIEKNDLVFFPIFNCFF